MEEYTEEQRDLIKSLGLSVNENGLLDFDEDGDVTYIITKPIAEESE
jgi:hypothetical protein